MKCRKLISIILAVMMIVATVPAVFAAPAGKQISLPFIIDPGDYYRYMITVYWNVVSANDNEDTHFRVVCYAPSDDTSMDNAYGGIHEDHNYERAARESGNQSWTFLSNGCPSMLSYYSYGRTANPTEWYITKITVTPLKPVEGYTKTAYTYWEGKLGMRIASFAGQHNAGSFTFYPDDSPNFGGWVAPSVGTNLTANTYDWKSAPYIEGILPINGPDTIEVPTSGDGVSYEYSHGLIYDNFGAEWPNQNLNEVEIREYRTDSYIGSDYFSHTGVKFSNNNNTVTLTPAANAKNDYKYLLIYKEKTSQEYYEHKTVTVKTFDYNVTFKDANGNTLKTQTVDYGNSATPPDAPQYVYKNGKIYKFSGWTGDVYTNITGANQDRTVTAAYDTEKGALSGSGTSTSPYEIKNAADWELFAGYCEADMTAGKYFKLKSYISTNIMAGSSNHDFQGVFDGDGNKITVNYGSSSSPITGDYASPFTHVKNAEIKNLQTGGNIYTSGKYAGGIIGGEWGTVNIENCRSSVSIHSSTVGDGTHGGIVGISPKSTGSNLTIRGCVFDGELLGENTTSCGGFIGYRNATASIYDSIFDPARVTISNDNSAMFARNLVDTHNSYYLYNFGTDSGNQWKAGRAISAGQNTSVAFAGSSTDYSVSGIKAYSTGIKYKNTMYAGNSESVSLSLGHTTPAGYTFNGYSASSGTINGSMLTMSSSGGAVVVSAVNNINKYTVTWKNADGTVLETDKNVPYGTKPTYNGSTPTKAPDADKTYSFKGWTPSVGNISGNTTYTATYNSESQVYTLSLWNWNGYSSAAAIFRAGSGNFTKQVNTQIRKAETAPDCTKGGSTVYTATAVYNGKTYTDTKTENLSPLGHDLIHFEAKDATAEEKGNIEYWFCKRCDKYFTDGDGRVQIEKDSVVIPVKIAHIQGDTDGDGSVTAKDVEYIKVVLAGEEGYVFDFCDVDGDRSITAKDVVLLKNILAS